MIVDWPSIVNCSTRLNVSESSLIRTPSSNSPLFSKRSSVIACPACSLMVRSIRIFPFSTVKTAVESKYLAIEEALSSVACSASNPTVYSPSSNVIGVGSSPGCSGSLVSSSLSSSGCSGFSISICSILDLSKWS